jgi:RNA polymerase sigma-70 factor, ECF subfamily
MVVLALNAFTLSGQDQASEAAGLDARLLTEAAAGNSRAFEQLVGRHYQIVYRVIWRLIRGHRDAEDITQEAFLRLWRNPSQVREAAALRSWLIRVATNLAMDGHRSQPLESLTQIEEPTDDRRSADLAMEQGEVARRVEQAISRLPERQRLALTLVQYEHMSNSEAAHVMEVSVDALESLLSRARRALKEDLAGEWQTMLASLAAES